MAKGAKQESQSRTQLAMWIVPLKNSWAFPVIEAAHLSGVALFVGTMLFADLRRLGLDVARQRGEELDRIFKPWAHSGLAILLATGALMWYADSERYRRNPAFGVKMALAVLALISYFVPRRHKAIAIVSLALWTGVVLAARAIADFDI
jgi:uncharacterized membrane protein